MVDGKARQGAFQSTGIRARRSVFRFARDPPVA